MCQTSRKHRLKDIRGERVLILRVRLWNTQLNTLVADFRLNLFSMVLRARGSLIGGVKNLTLLAPRAGCPIAISLSAVSSVVSIA